MPHHCTVIDRHSPLHDVCMELLIQFCMVCVSIVVGGLQILTMDGLIRAQEMCIVCLATVASRHYTLCTPTPLPAAQLLVSSRFMLMLKLHPMIIHSTIGCIVQ